MKHLRYLRYVLRHKWFVFLECFRAGLIWRGIVHDLSKFSLTEWGPYVEKFYGDNQDGRLTKIDFRDAWEHHYEHNDHHWEHWLWDGEQLGLGDCNGMPRLAILEMLADWRAMARTVGNGDAAEWYLQNRDRIKLEPRTRAIVEDELGIEKKGGDVA